MEKMKSSLYKLTLLFCTDETRNQTMQVFFFFQWCTAKEVISILKMCAWRYTWNWCLPWTRWKDEQKTVYFSGITPPWRESPNFSSPSSQERGLARKGGRFHQWHACTSFLPNTFPLGQLSRCLLKPVSPMGPRCGYSESSPGTLCVA